MSRSASAQPLNWRRVSALSSTFSLHVLAVAAALLVISAPGTPPQLLRVQPQPLQLDLRDPPPIQAPTPPVAQPPPPVAVQRVQAATPLPTSPVVEPVAPVMPVVTGPVVVADALPTVPALPKAGIQAAVAYADVRAPDYPPIARSRGQEGEALLRVLVATDGRAVQVRIQHSSGHSILDRAAIQTVRGWRFHPAQVDGVVREAWIVVPVNFRIDRR